MAKPNEKFKTLKNVFDDYTEKNLFKLISEGHFEGLSTPIAIGKEANVFAARKGDGFVIVKIYRLETCDFNRMYDYIKMDSRYIGLKKKKREIIFAWTQREYRNLHKVRSTGVKVPTPYAFVDNIIVMELIGENEPAPKLKDELPKNKDEFLEKIISFIKKMHEAGIVHGDLSEFNILNYRDSPVFIDFSQTTVSETANYTELLERDISNIARFFNKIGLSVDREKIKKRITG
ncbi:Kae1-associated serine/threonine protein kinase [Candidatus Woesearchaeota archaeon]|nr:Kae1-associated serine/threonine protein kinase [Candidatus Woesearchaeota archaeon]